eukprot:TRINITY_DN4635_c0_g1_i2.p1 TRINITY_DN4635_c0_g1~~TRINITY_DN4635_c0_g1_i2.p1  ORF type:complete len:586 (+),score=120.58 TRINITY_DN4635_c0_g1_i2:75-1832(+)
MKRVQIASVACDTCRQKHRKCDGKQPKCSECIQSGATECVYPMTVRKRGPPKGEKKELEKRIQMLLEKVAAQEEELNRLKSNQKEEEQEHEQEGHSLVSYQPKDVQLSPLITSANRAFACASHINMLLNGYNMSLRPLLMITVPSFDLDELITERKGTSFNEPLCMQIYTMAALGAMALGKLEFADTFAMTARNIAKEWFDKADINAATCFALLTYYCIGAGQFEAGMNYTFLLRAMTKTIREQVKGKTQGKALDYGPSSNLHKELMANHLDQITVLVGFCRDPQSQECALREVVRDIEGYTFQTPQTKMNLVLALIGRVKASILLDELNGGSLQELPAHLRTIDRAESLCKEVMDIALASKIVDDTRYRELESRLRILSKGLRAMVYAAGGYQDVVSSLTNEVLSSLSVSNGLVHIDSFFSLHFCLEAHRFAFPKSMPPPQMLFLMQKYVKHYPVWNIILGKIGLQITQNAEGATIFAPLPASACSSVSCSVQSSCSPSPTPSTPTLHITSPLSPPFGLFSDTAPVATYTTESIEQRLLEIDDFFSQQLGLTATEFSQNENTTTPTSPNSSLFTGGFEIELDLI